MINALPNTEMVFVCAFTLSSAAGFLSLFRILLEQMCKLNLLWVDPLLKEPLPLSVGGREDSRCCSLNPLPCSKSVSMNVDLKCVNENNREKGVLTCLLSPPAGSRMKIPRTREGKPRILCYPHSIPSRGALAVATAGVEPLVTARQTWSDPGAGAALSVGSPACLPSSADSPTTPPASCPDHMTLLEYIVSCLTSGTRLFSARKVIELTHL